MKKKTKKKVDKILRYKTLEAFIKNKKIPRRISPTMSRVPTLMKELATHFKKDKWPLSLDHVRSELFYAITGTDELGFIVRELAKRNVYVGYGEEDSIGSVLYLDVPKGKKK